MIFSCKNTYFIALSKEKSKNNGTSKAMSLSLMLWSLNVIFPKSNKDSLKIEHRASSSVSKTRMGDRFLTVRV